MLIKSQDQGTALAPAFPDAGSVAQHLDHSVEPELVKEKHPESFLGARPVPPPPPDTRIENEALSHILETTSLPTSPRAKTETRSRRFSDAEISKSGETTATLSSSPTAVPFHFRQPSRSSSTVQSLSQTSLPINKTTADLPPKQKTRPRSTEFKSSKEIRPLRLVERHRSHQEPSTDGTYPSLPASHTTSRSSSVHDMEESGHDHSGVSRVDKTEVESKTTAVEPRPIISADSLLIQSDLQNSQQATPTASSFQDLRIVQDLPSPQASRGSPTKEVLEETHQQSFSALQSGLLGAISGSFAPLALKEAMHNDEPSRQDLSGEGKEKSEHGLDDVDMNVQAYHSDNDSPDQEDLASRKARTAGQLQQEMIQGPHAEAARARQSTNSIEPESLSSDSMRQIREQSAQGAEGPWSPSGPGLDHGRKANDWALVEMPLEEIRPPPDAYKPPWDDAKYTTPAEGQEIDTLTREMSREQIVDIMATAAQGHNKSEYEASRPASAVFREPFEIQVEESRSESKGRRSKESRKSLPQDDNAQEDLQKIPLPQQEHLQEQPRDDRQEDKILQRDLEQDTVPNYDLPHAGLPRIETRQQIYPQGDLNEVNLSRDDLLQLQANVPQDKIPQDDARPDGQSALSSSAAANFTSIDPISEEDHETMQLSPKAKAAPLEEIDHGDLTAISAPLERSPRAAPLPDSDHDYDSLDERPETPAPTSLDHGDLTAISAPLELSPRATPLPDSDHDYDSLDERPETPAPTSLDHVDDKEINFFAENPFDSPHLHIPSAVIIGPQKISQDLPTQAKQIDVDNYLAAPSKKKSKQDRQATQSFSVQDSENTKIQEKDRLLPDEVNSTVLVNDHLKELDDEPVEDKSQEKPEVVEEERGSFTETETGKKEEKTKQSDWFENSNSTDAQERQQPLPTMVVSGPPEDHDPVNLIDESTHDISQPKIGFFVDDSTDSNGKKKRRKGKKVKPSFGIEDSQTAAIEEEDESPSKMVDSKAPEHYESTGLIHEPAMHVPNPEVVEDGSIHLVGVPTKQAPKPEVVEDKWADFDRKHKSKSNAENLEPAPEETDKHFERQTDARDDMNDRTSPSATTRTSQEVRPLLESDITKDATAGEPNAAISTVSRAEHTLQQSSADKVSSMDEPSKPVAYESETPELEGDLENACEIEGPPTLDTSVAGTDAAQNVQDILTGEDNATAATDAKREAIVASTGEEERATSIVVEEEELDWNAPRKKKKGKKGKKNETSSWDNPKLTEAATSSSPTGAINTTLEEKIMEDKKIDKDEQGWDAPKNKKKGKKGKKKEVLSLDRPGIEKPAELPAAINAPLEPEPTAKAADEVSSKRSREGKDKKGKRKEFLRVVSEVRDKDEPNVVSTEVSRAEDLVEDFHGIAVESRDNGEPGGVPNLSSKDDNQVEVRPALDPPSTTGVVREDVEPSPILRQTPRDDDGMEDPLAGGMLPTRAADCAPGEALEPARPTRVAQDSDDEKSRGVRLEQEQDFMPPKSKKEKKRQKKSKKFNALSPDDNEYPPLADGEKSETNNLDKDRPEETIAPSTDVVENSEKTIEKRQSGQGEDSMLPTHKKDKKKSKKSKSFGAFPLNIDDSPTLQDDPASEVKDYEKAVPELTPYRADVVDEHESSVEGIPEEKQREESKEAKPTESITDYITPQGEQEATPEFNQDSKVDSNIDPLDGPGDIGIAEGKSGEAMHGHFDPVSAHAGALDNSHKSTSSVLSSLAEPVPVDASEEIITYRVNKLEDNIDSAVETDMDPLNGLKSSQKDLTSAMKAQPLTWEKDEIPQEPRAIFRESSVTENPIESSIIHISRDSESWSKPKLHAQETDFKEIVLSDSTPENDHGSQGIVLEGQPSQASDEIPQMTGAEQEESGATIIGNGAKSQTTKNEKLYVPEPEEDRSSVDEEKLASVTAASSAQERTQTSEQEPRDDLHTTGEIPSNQEETVEGVWREQTPILTGSGAFNEEFSGDVPAQKVAKHEQEHDGTHGDETRTEDFSSSASRKPVLQTAETVPDLETISIVEPLGSPDIDKSVPAVHVEMLDAQEQRVYNEEYAKELKRQLSPPQEGERADFSRDEADTPAFPQSSIASVMERTYEEEHRPLAKPPALEDIAEEPKSRSGSVQGSPADQEDEFTPFKPAKKSRKGRKGKKQQPIIWEDETATPLLKPESDQTAKPPARSLEVPGTSDIDATQPSDLEEPEDQRSLEDKTDASPTEDFQAAINEKLTEKDWSGDYFAIRPSRPAEEEVGREDTREFHRALSPEPHYSLRERSPAREPQITRDGQPRDDAVKAYNAHGEPDSLTTDIHYRPNTEAEPAEDQFEDNVDPPAVMKIQEGEDSTTKASARDSSPQASGQESLQDRPQDTETPSIDSLNDRPLSRQYSLRSTPHEEDGILPEAEQEPADRSSSGIMEGIPAAAGLGAGIVAAESLSRADSKNEGSLNKEAKEDGKRTDFEAETGEKESSFDRGVMAFKEQEHLQALESEDAGRMRQHRQATPPLPPPPSANHEAIVHHPLVGDLGPSSETPKDRDSAIHVSGSPMISEEIPSLNALRDSGYIDTEASPIIDDELKKQGDLTELESGINAGEGVGHVQHPHIWAHGSHVRQESRSRKLFETQVEANSDYNVSVSRSREKRKHSRGRSGAAYDSDDSADSGFDIQRRRRQQATAEEPREPSPVSSTTKDRSSALFDSSLSAREATIAKPQNQEVSLPYDPVREELTWSFDREPSTKEQPRETSSESRSVNDSERAPDPIGHEIPAGNREDTGTSLFGGPQSSEDDSKSPPRSRRSSESRGRRRLTTISEDGADGSPLHKKDKRAVSDVGSPESGVKGRRMRSPPVEDDVAEHNVSTYDSMSRQAWPMADEEKYVVGERSRSRNSDQLSNLSSQQARHRGEEYRTASAMSAVSAASAASITSDNSIHAIIRTPDQVRSASGLSYRSSETLTPPLRRVDRSASGDLRGASQRSEARSRAKSSSEHGADRGIGIPSSSTYDPVTDKGKSPANMTDVYVSHQQCSWNPHCCSAHRLHAFTGRLG